MPRVHHVKKARKENKAHEIKVGDSYYWWKTRMKGQRDGVMHYSKTHPRPSQLTMSEYLGQAYAIQEGIEDQSQGLETKDDVHELGDSLVAAADDVRTLGSEQQEKFDNMPDGLQQGDTGQLIESRANACEEIAQALEDAGKELQGWEPNMAEQEDPEQSDAEAEKDQAQAAVDAAVADLSWDWEG